jgi:hypothetical protein
MDEENFEVSLSARNALDLISNGNELLILSNNSPHFSIQWAFKLLITLMGKYSQVCGSCQTNQEVWDNIRFYLLSLVSSERNLSKFSMCMNIIGQMIIESCDDFDFSVENAYLIKRFVTNHDEMLNPNFYNGICPTTGFLMFLIHDACEYLGLLSKKPSAERIYQESLFEIQMLKDTKGKLEEISQRMNIVLNE